jgi:phosphoenolpyruvate carboxylase
VLLWQTRPLRFEKLYVADEIDNALTYLRDVFLPTAARALCPLGPRAGQPRASLPAPGNWIGGDRDGNPFVTADPPDGSPAALGRRGARPLSDAVHALGAELSISATIAPIEAVEALAEASGDNAPSRRDEPYRRALSGIYARLCRDLSRTSSASHRRVRARSRARPIPIRRRFPRRSARHREWPGRAGWRRSAGGSGALGRLIRAVDIFGFHLATLDMRQNSAVHERVLAELLKVSGSRAIIWRWTKRRGLCCFARN